MQKAEVRFGAIFVLFLVFLLGSMVVVVWFRSCQELSSLTGGFLILKEAETLLVVCFCGIGIALQNSPQLFFSSLLNNSVIILNHSLPCNKSLFA